MLNPRGIAFLLVLASLVVGLVAARKAGGGWLTDPTAPITLELVAWPLALGLYATELWQLAEKAAPPWTAGSLLYLVAAGAAACIAALTWRGYQLRSFAHRVAALFYLALAGVLLIGVLCLAPGTYGLPVLQPRGAAYLVLIAALTATLMAYRRRGRPEDRERKDWSWGLTVILHAAALVFFTLEGHDFWIVRAPGWFENPQHGWYARHMTLSLGYALYGFALLWTGILRRQTLLRVLAPHHPGGDNL